MRQPKSRRPSRRERAVPPPGVDLAALASVARYTASSDHKGSGHRFKVPSRACEQMARNARPSSAKNKWRAGSAPRSPLVTSAAYGSPTRTHSWCGNESTASSSKDR